MTNDSAGYGRITNILLIEDNLEEARRIELMLDLTQDAYQLLTAVSVKTARHTLETEKSKSFCSISPCQMAKACKPSAHCTPVTPKSPS